MSNFLPITMREVEERGWDAVDFVCVTGDAYVDHPSFGIAIISRLLESLGYRVAILSQPNPASDRDFQRFGKPRLGFLVTGGNIDSMVAHYTAAKRRRSEDSYTAGGKAGKRPDRATIVYASRIRELYPDSFIAIGGLEASLRRFAHYDYWDDAVRPSILLDSKADLLMYGMGEHTVTAIAGSLDAGKTVEDMHGLRGICYLARQYELPQEAVSCASYAKVSENKLSYAKATKSQIDEQDHIYGKAVIQKHGEFFLVQTPPSPPLTQSELDRVFSLPYQRMYHPSYDALGGVPAIEEVEFSINHNRGCFGNCNFCSIAFHQGRQIVSRSEKSVLTEAERFTHNPRFKGYIHDVGGPTANFRNPSCTKQLKSGLCKDRKCLAPTPCRAIQADHNEYLSLLRKLREIKGVKKVFVRSGLRYDYMLLDKDDTFMRELITHHVSGQLKVAPEHCSPNVLDRMGKPHIDVYERFQKKFYQITNEVGKEQYLVPYLMSSHPGSTINDAVNLALFLKKNRIRPEQVQDFYPTPGTVSTCMFYTGLDPTTLKEVYVPRTDEEKQLQRALLQYFKPYNRPMVIQALRRARRTDLIGTDPGCLIMPDRHEQATSKNEQSVRSHRREDGTRTPRRGRGRTR